jgi:Ca2+-binding EF-hand superfamily protein
MKLGPLVAPLAHQQARPPRGTAIQLGGLSGARTISAHAQLSTTAGRLRGASESYDMGELHAALACADELRLPAALSRTPEAEDLRRLAAETRLRLDTDPELRRDAALRRSKPVKVQVRRLWDLMIAESKFVAENGGEQLTGNGAEVTRAGYRKMHSRVAMALIESGKASPADRDSLADRDWAEDVERFVGTSHIMVFLDQIKTRFQTAASAEVARHGFKTLFARYDLDGSGELDMDEFTKAIRADLAITPELLSNEEVSQLFAAVDTDGGGQIDITEFMDWLFGASLTAGRSEKSITRVKTRFRQASAAICEEIGWKCIFDKYDADGSGELELDEFTTAVREECDLPSTVVSDDEVSEIFGVIDADQSGSIDSKELRALLKADLGATALTFGAFYGSILELVSVWADEQTPQQFVIFLSELFESITLPINGHSTEEDLQSVPIFDDAFKQEIPNFKLRALDDVQSLVRDGLLCILGFKAAAPVMQQNDSPTGAQGIGGARRRRRKTKFQISDRLMNSTMSSRQRIQPGQDLKGASPVLASLRSRSADMIRTAKSPLGTSSYRRSLNESKPVMPLKLRLDKRRWAKQLPELSHSNFASSVSSHRNSSPTSESPGPWVLMPDATISPSNQIKHSNKAPTQQLQRRRMVRKSSKSVFQETKVQPARRRQPLHPSPSASARKTRRVKMRSPTQSKSSVTLKRN